MSKYTKGKWEVYAEINIRSENGRHIASCGVNMPNQEKAFFESKANSHLIASAPELLEACKKAAYILDGERGYENLYTTLQQAISKAEGAK